jgi:hypothetical protein
MITIGSKYILMRHCFEYEATKPSPKDQINDSSLKKLIYTTDVTQWQRKSSLCICQISCEKAKYFIKYTLGEFPKRHE